MTKRDCVEVGLKLFGVYCLIWSAKAVPVMFGNLALFFQTLIGVALAYVLILRTETILRHLGYPPDEEAD